MDLYKEILIKALGQQKMQITFPDLKMDINEILDDMVATGIDVLHPLDPSANMDIMDCKKSKPLSMMTA